jgi:phage terminase large subunit GpA-like protein
MSIAENDLWSARERRAWTWPEKMSPSQWSERYRILTPDLTSEPGPWRGERVPYAAGLMDLFTRDGLEGIVCMKGAQIGWSEIMRNWIGYCIDRQPGPAMLVLPDRTSGQAAIVERVKPLLFSTPAVARHLTDRSWDITNEVIKTDAMSLFLAWATSSQALKSRPIRYIFFDEPDEYPRQTGPGGDPLSKGLKRLTTYAAKGKSRACIGGTPTTKHRPTWVHYQLCDDQKLFFCECPFCGLFQPLRWGAKGEGAGVKWPNTGEKDQIRRAARLKSEHLAAYQCAGCAKLIHDDQKQLMLAPGVWCGQGQTVDKGGKLQGDERQAKWVGVHIPSMYSPWLTFSDLAAEWIIAQAGDRMALMDFVNQRLAEPFELTSSETDKTILESKAPHLTAKPGETVDVAKRLIVPKWAMRLIATADTQGVDAETGYFYYSIRAWGFGWKSQLVDWGIVKSQAELYALCFNKPYPIEGGGECICHFLIIDSGGPRWQEVYDFAMDDPARVHPAKGANHPLVNMLDRRVNKDHGVILWYIDTLKSKDQLHALIHDADPARWALCDAVTQEYLDHLQAEHKIINPDGAESWVTKPGRPANHSLDLEHMQVAGAWIEGCGMNPPPDDGDEPKPDNPPQPSGTWVGGGTW